MFIKQLLLATGTLASILIAQPVMAELILPGRCHMGECWDNKFISKTQLREGSNGTLYAVEMASRSWSFGSEPPAKFDSPTIRYVHCSTTKPAYIFNSDGTYYAHLLNPGGDWYGYNVGDYPVYWATCHNFVGPEFFSEKMTSRAVQLGYPLNLSSEQIELNNVLEIMQ